MMRPYLFFIYLVVAFFLQHNLVHAAEGGSGFYLLGTRHQMAGTSLPTGHYLKNDLYLYTGQSRDSATLPMAGSIYVGVDASAYVNLSTLIWVPNISLGSSQLTFNATLPVGYKQARAFAKYEQLSGKISDHIFTVGDPTLGMSLGWNKNYWSWNISGLANIPIGHYRKNQLSNLSYHHWGLDLTSAVTYFNPQTGWDLSAAAGITYNHKNRKTQYKTGNEGHIELAITKFLSPQLSLGLASYHYQQLTADSGQGAVLGSYKGRTSALGFTSSYQVNQLKKPITLQLRAYKEFSTRNRVQGAAGYLSIVKSL